VVVCAEDERDFRAVECTKVLALEKVLCRCWGKKKKVLYYTRNEDEALTLILIPKGRHLGISKAEGNCRILGTCIFELENERFRMIAFSTWKRSLTVVWMSASALVTAGKTNPG
jgi:hypothetical protein